MVVLGATQHTHLLGILGFDFRILFLGMFKVGSHKSFGDTLLVCGGVD